MSHHLRHQNLCPRAGPRGAGIDVWLMQTVETAEPGNRLWSGAVGDIMTDVSDLEALLAGETGLAVITTLKADGRPLSSVVNVGVVDHPVDSDRVVAFVANGSSARLGHLRRSSTINVLVRRAWQWAAVEGDAQLVGPDDPHPDIDDDALRLLIRRVFQAAGGTHDDFDEFDRVMVEDRRCVVLVAPRRYYSNPA